MAHSPPLVTTFHPFCSVTPAQSSRVLRSWAPPSMAIPRMGLSMRDQSSVSFGKAPPETVASETIRSAKKDG